MPEKKQLSTFFLNLEMVLNFTTYSDFITITLIPFNNTIKND